jgi:hypothetical protein
MRRSFLLLIVFLCTIGIYAQESTEISKKLLAKYSNKTLQKLSENNSDSMLVLNYAAEKGYYFMDIPSNKNIVFEKIENVTEKDLETFNPFKYNVTYFKEKQNYYILGDTGKLLVLMSLKDMMMFSQQDK